jgi:hypothetical protein
MGIRALASGKGDDSTGNARFSPDKRNELVWIHEVCAKPIITPEQEQTLDTLLWRCRTLYNVALEERKTAWDRCGVSVGYYGAEGGVA